MWYSFCFEITMNLSLPEFGALGRRRWRGVERDQVAARICQLLPGINPARGVIFRTNFWPGNDAYILQCMLGQLNGGQSWFCLEHLPYWGNGVQIDIHQVTVYSSATAMLRNFREQKGASLSLRLHAHRRLWDETEKSIYISRKKKPTLLILCRDGL
jgi:hypothetical protein